MHRHNVSQLKPAPTGKQRKRAASSDCIPAKASAAQYQHNKATAVTITMNIPRHIDEPPPEPETPTRPLVNDPAASTTTDNSSEQEEEEQQQETTTVVEASTTSNDNEQQEEHDEQQEEHNEHPNDFDTSQQQQEQTNNSSPEAEEPLAPTHQQQEPPRSSLQKLTNGHDASANTRRSTRTKQRPERYEDQGVTMRRKSTEATGGQTV